MISVFICMKYGDHNTLELREYNTKAAMAVWHTLRAAGFAPYCPHLSHYLHEFRPCERQQWLNQGLHWLERCDCVIVFGDETEGMAAEVKRAYMLGKPVFRTFGDIGSAYGVEV
jgi:nucleoside 2-deoxyribosyltransferase